MGRSISAEDQEGPARDPGISRAPTPLHKEVYSHRNYLSNGVLPIRYQSDSFRSLRDLDYLGRRNIPTGSLSRISWTGCDNLSSQSEANGSDLPDEQRDHAGRVVSRGAREQTVDLGKDRREPAAMTNLMPPGFGESDLSSDSLKFGHVAKCILGYRTDHCYWVRSRSWFASASEFITPCSSFMMI